MLNVVATLWERLDNAEEQRYHNVGNWRYKNSHFRPSLSVMITSTTTLWQRCHSVAVPAGKHTRNNKSTLFILFPNFEIVYRSYKKSCLEKFCSIIGKASMEKLFEKRLQHRSLPGNVAKFFKADVIQNTWDCFFFFSYFDLLYSQRLLSSTKWLT